MKFLENEVRAVRGAKLYSFEYWVHTEVLIDGKWVTPYLVDEEKLNWYETDVKLNPTEKNMKEYLSNQLWVINDCLERGYKLVSYEKFKEVIHRYHFPNDYNAKVVYL